MGLHVCDEAIVSEISLEGSIKLFFHEFVSLQQGSECLYSKLGGPSASCIKISPQFFKNLLDTISAVQDIVNHHQ